MIFLNFDKAGAEWVVVAYLSGDERMLDVVKSGRSPHVATGALISGASEALVQLEHEKVGDANDPYTIEEIRATIPELQVGGLFLPRTMSIRQAGKKSNHALNYGEGYRVFALYNEMEESEAKKIVDFYTTRAYPGVRLYHQATERELRSNGRTLVNCFGRKVVLRGPWDAHLLKKGYSFKPQSTVVDMVNQGMVKGYRDESREMWEFEILAQVHDSLLCQAPCPLHTNRMTWHDLALCCQRMDKYMSPTCNYGFSPISAFKIKTDLKIGLDWQHMEKVSISKDADKMAADLEATYVRLTVTTGSQPVGQDSRDNSSAMAEAS